MAQVELIMPKMGESIMEATILKWVKKAGDMVALDETILEIATDKVDTEIPSPVAGKISKILFQEDEVVEIGKVIALIETDVNASISESPAVSSPATSSAVPQTVHGIYRHRPHRSALCNFPSHINCVLSFLPLYHL